MGGFIDTAESRQFIASCRLLAHHAGLHSHRMLCWFLIPESIGCGLHSLLYLPPSSLSENFSVAAEEEYERGEYSLSELHLDSCIETLTHNDGPGQALDIAAAAQYANATFANATFAGSTTTGRLSLISRSSDSDSHNCASDWGKSNDEIDWDAITNGDIKGNVE